MKAVIQRVTNALVTIAGKEISEIGKGFLILLGVTHSDTEAIAEKLAHKIVKLRIMADETDKMNLNLHDSGGEILVVSQFTLYADTSKGNRPSFIKAADPKQAEQLYDYFVVTLRKTGLTVKTGIFGALMQVSLTNDGPVTIILEEN
ncbi:MAG: D-tyrosyl-tRNA(Tyr) deacylase [Candidatus Chisholmbacteria bacterium]|nr:D-tyrosyl-tRNA(Tyr) deacylase [Candidatus Chisholmbacteria bacterium]